MHDELAIREFEHGLTVWDFLLVVYRRLWLMLVVIAISVGTAYLVSANTPKRWKASAQLMHVQRAAPIVVTPQQGAYTPPAIETTETQVALLQSHTMAQRTLDLLKNEALAKGKSSEDVRIAVQDLKDAIIVTPVKDTNLIDVAVEAGTRDEAGKLANAACRAFVQWKTEAAKANTDE